MLPFLRPHEGITSARRRGPSAQEPASRTPRTASQMSRTMTPSIFSMVPFPKRTHSGSAPASRAKVSFCAGPGSRRSRSPPRCPDRQAQASSETRPSRSGASPYSWQRWTPTESDACEAPAVELDRCALELVSRTTRAGVVAVGKGNHQDRFDGATGGNHQDGSVVGNCIEDATCHLTDRSTGPSGSGGFGGGWG